jgi:hypothetical protein
MKVVASRALPALGPNFVMGPWVNRDYDDVLAQQGDTVNVPIAPNMTTNNLAEGGTVTNQNPSLGNVQVVLTSHQEATFSIPNITQALATPNLIDTYMQPAVLAIAEKVESDLLNIYPLFAANAAVGTANTPLTEAVIGTGETELFNSRMPDSLQKYAVVSGTAYDQLRQIPRFSEQRMVGNATAIYSGTIGTLKGVIFARSQKVVQVGTTTNNIMFGRDAIILCTRNLPPIIPGTGAISQNINFQGFGMRVVMSFNPQTLSQQFTVDCLYGIAVGRNQFGVVVLN